MNAKYIQCAELVREISLQAVNYEAGDLLLISEMIDNLSRLRQLCSDLPVGVQICGILSGLLQRLMKATEKSTLEETLYRGIELLSKLFASCAQPDALLQESLEAFLAQTADFQSGPANMLPPVRSSNESSGEASAGTSAGDITTPALRFEDETLKLFLMEADERLVTAQDYIMELEQNPGASEILNKLFRVFHTIKGECGFLNIPVLGQLAHSLENLLDKLRNQELKNSPQVTEILLSGVDRAFSMLCAMRAEDRQALDAITTGDLQQDIEALTCTSSASIGEILQQAGKLSPAEVGQILQKQKETNFTKKFGEIAVTENFLSAGEIEQALECQSQRQKSPGQGHAPEDNLIKVKSSRINYLVDMIGELLIAENQLDERDKNVIQLKKISRAIQSAAMQLRTVKVRNLFINMRRVTRDTAHKMQRDVVLLTRGDDLEIDRNLVEAVEEPLMHVIRNAVGHGIETPEEREAAGKKRVGEILLTAGRQGNHIIISVRDDGAGLACEQIVSRAVEKKIVSPEEAGQLSENEVYNLLFLPGFSTAREVSDVSGRGVGMDIVKSMVTRARGQVRISSEVKHFTEIELSFPLSMAIIDGMITRVHTSFFIIPVAVIRESVQIHRSMISRVAGREEVLNLRGQVIPLVSLAGYFFQEHQDREPAQVAVIVDVNSRFYALSVHEILAKKEIVIKPLGRKFAGLKGLSSGTILPGGKIGFVLDADKVVSGAGEGVA